MKYDIVYKCGHMGTVELFGKNAERERKLQWYRTQAVCPDCYAAEKRATLNDIASEYNLPELIGSDKQIAWAEKIRTDYIAQKEKQAAENEKMYAQAIAANVPNASELIEKSKSIFNNFCAEFFAETRASKWIDISNKIGCFSKKLHEYAANNK